MNWIKDINAASLSTRLVVEAQLSPQKISEGLDQRVSGRTIHRWSQGESKPANNRDLAALQTYASRFLRRTPTVDAYAQALSCECSFISSTPAVSDQQLVRVLHNLSRFSSVLLDFENKDSEWAVSSGVSDLLTVCSLLERAVSAGSADAKPLVEQAEKLLSRFSVQSEEKDEEVDAPA